MAVRNYPNDRLRQIMRAKNVTGTRLAFDLGIHQPLVSRYALGWQIPPIELQERIAAYVGVDISRIWPDEQEGGELDG